MKNERKWTQEIEMLSAYLDDALKPAERQGIEARLIREPQLRERLQDLQVTRSLIRNLPRQKAPRPFTLTSDMVRVRQPRRKSRFNFLKLASSFAAILLVFLLGVEVLFSQNVIAFPQPLAAAPMAESDEILDEATPMPLIYWGEPAAGAGGDAVGIGGAGSSEPKLESLPETSAPEKEPAEEEPSEDRFETQPTDQTSFAEEEKPDRAPEEEGPILGLNIDQGGEIVDDNGIETETAPPQGATPKALRYAQIGLAIIALGAGMAFILLKKH